MAAVRLDQWLSFIGTAQRLAVLADYLSGREYLLDHFRVADAYLVAVLNGTLAIGRSGRCWWHISRACASGAARTMREERRLTQRSRRVTRRHDFDLSRLARVELQSRAEIDSHEWSEMANADKRKQSLYFPEDMLKEIQHEAQRLDRSLSWIVQQGWKIARDKLKAFPASNDEPEGLPDPREETT